MLCDKHHGNETSHDSHQPVGHLAEPVSLIETKVIIFILSPDKQTRLPSYRGGLERNTLERPERQTGRETQTVKQSGSSLEVSKNHHLIVVAVLMGIISPGGVSKIKLVRGKRPDESNSRTSMMIFTICVWIRPANRKDWPPEKVQ